MTKILLLHKQVLCECLVNVIYNYQIEICFSGRGAAQQQSLPLPINLYHTDRSIPRCQHHAQFWLSSAFQLFINSLYAIVKGHLTLQLMKLTCNSAAFEGSRLIFMMWATFTESIEGLERKDWHPSKRSTISRLFRLKTIVSGLFLASAMLA